MSAALSSAAEVLAGGPLGCTSAEGGTAAPPPPRSERKSMPVAQLRTSASSSPPTPRPPALIPMPPPELPRASSMLLRSPLLHFMYRSLYGSRAACRGANRTPDEPGDWQAGKKHREATLDARSPTAKLQNR